MVVSNCSARCRGDYAYGQLLPSTATASKVPVRFGARVEQVGILIGGTAWGSNALGQAANDRTSTAPALGKVSGIKDQQR